LSEHLDKDEWLSIRNRQPETPKAACGICGLSFWSETLLAIHLRDDHNSDEVARRLAVCYVHHHPD